MKLCSRRFAKAFRRGAVAVGVGLFAGIGPVLAAELFTVTVNQSRLLRLQQDADIIMVANPTIADVAVESTRMLFVLGLEPGETSLHILDSQGNTIRQFSIVVVPTEERTVTVNRANNLEEATYSCSPRCAAVGTAVGTGAAVPTGGGDDSATDPAAAAAGITDSSSGTTTGTTTTGSTTTGTTGG